MGSRQTTSVEDDYFASYHSNHYDEESYNWNNDENVADAKKVDADDIDDNKI